MAFPPVPLYPLQLDTDRTLFLVYNTAETRLAVDNQPWEEDMSIVPVAANFPEIWANNGFGTISGELFYYDSVEKNINGKVITLKGCARNIGGNATRFNYAGTWVRGFVIAEHHNQLVEAIINVEEFVDDVATRIEALSIPDCIDDFNCATINFTFNIQEPTNQPCEGVIADYLVSLTGTYTNIKIDFGDGNWTYDLSGTHAYAPNKPVDPMVTVQSEDCTLIQTTPDRVTSIPITPPTDTPPYEIPTCDIPELPELNFPELSIPTTNFTTPPIIIPNLDIGSFPSIYINISIGDINIQIPSIISFGPLNIPSIIWFGPLNIPSIINFGPVNIPSIINFGPVNIPSIINFGPVNIPSIINFGPVNIPSIINFGPVNIPSIINFGPVDMPSIINFGDVNIPSIINFGPVDMPSTIVIIGISAITVEPIIGISLIEVEPITGISLIEVEPITGISIVEVESITGISEISVIWGTPPGLSVEWGTPPGLPVEWGDAPVISVDWGNCNCTINVSCAGAQPGMVQPMRTLEETFTDSFETINPVVTALGIPSEIVVKTPRFSPIEVKHNVPSTIEIMSANIPSVIEVHVFENIPNEIHIINETNLPDSIKLNIDDLPSKIVIDGSHIPNSIELVPVNLPSRIIIDASDIPDTIQVVGIPPVIELKGNIPSEIFLKLPENIEIPLVYRGGPIPVQFDLGKLSDPTIEDAPCFAIIPCPKR